MSISTFSVMSQLWILPASVNQNHWESLIILFCISNHTISSAISKNNYDNLQLSAHRAECFSHQRNTRAKAKINHCTLPKFPAWPRGMHSILTSLSAPFKSGYLFIQPVSAKFKVSRSGLGGLTFSLPLPSLRHVAQVPVAPLAPDIQAVLQEPFRTTWCTAQSSDLPTCCFTSRWSSTSACRPTCGGTTRCWSPSSRVGPNSQSTRFDRFDTFFVLCWFLFSTCLVVFYPFVFVVFVYTRLIVICVSDVAWVL